MADYILKNKKRLTDLFKSIGYSDADLISATNTAQLRNDINIHSQDQNIFELLSKFFILKYIFDYAEMSFQNYDTAIDKDINEVLGPEPAHECIKIQRKSGLIFPFTIWTKRTIRILLSITAVWLVFLIYLYYTYPELWIFTFQLPIDGLMIIFLPALLLLLTSQRFFGQEKFEKVNTLEELVNEVYKINKKKIQKDDFAYLNEELNNYVNKGI